MIRAMADYTLKRLEEIPDVLGDYPGEMRMGSLGLDAEQVAFTWRRMPPQTGGKGSYGHRHRTQEEIYFVADGTLQFKLEDEVFDVPAPGTVVRVATERGALGLERGPGGRRADHLFGQDRRSAAPTRRWCRTSGRLRGGAAAAGLQFRRESNDRHRGRGSSQSGPATPSTRPRCKTSETTPAARTNGAFCITTMRNVPFTSWTEPIGTFCTPARCSPFGPRTRSRPASGAGAPLLPLNRPGRLRRDVERNPVDLPNLVDHARSNTLQQVIRQPRPGVIITS